MEHYQEVRDAVFDVAETLKHRHSYAFFFLVGLLNNILKTPIYYKADIEAEQLKQLSVCLEELERIIRLQEVFREAVDRCLGRENRPDKIMSERLCEFMAGHPEFGDAEGVSLMPYYLIEYLDEMLFFEKGIEADTFLQQYLTEYNKVYSRRYRAAGKYAQEHSGRDLTEGQFKAWSAAASQAGGIMWRATSPARKCWQECEWINRGEKYAADGCIIHFGGPRNF